MNIHEEFMKLALNEASAALDEGEVPIGAVIVKDGRVIASGHNQRETEKNALLHAEITVIGKACTALKSWRLSGCTLYVTLEPCPMCAGAVINARIDTVFFGARDRKGGACGSVIDLFACPFNHRPTVIPGVLGDPCAEMLRRFFSEKRPR